MQFLCSCRCWRCICPPIPRCTGERRAKSRETRSTRTCCLIPASNTCTSPRRKRSSSLRLGRIDYSFFFFLLNPFLSPSIHLTPLHRHMKKVVGLLGHFFCLSYLIIYSFIWRTPIHPSILPHRSQPLIYSLILFLSLFPSLLRLLIRLSLLCPFIFPSPSLSAATPKWNWCYWFRNELIRMHFKRAIHFDQVKWRYWSLFHLLI